MSSVQGARAVADERVFRRWDYPVFAVLTALNLGTLALVFAFWFSPSNWGHRTVLFVLITVPFLFTLAMFESRWLLLPLMRRPRHMAARSGWKVGVATTFVPRAEPIEMLERTLRELVAMDYPHDTWVLDEGDDDDVKALCAQHGARHYSRKGKSQYETSSGRYQARTKHGNYNAWLSEAGFDRYDLVVAFDPDHVPQRDFLLRVLGYFDDPEIGYVQAAQVYYNQAASFIARGAAEETYAYYSSLQMTSYAIGYPIVTGCHNTHRVTALKDVGGFAPHEADDLLITIYYRVAGWKGVYVPEILARGINPVDWPRYLNQQRRWGRSVLDIKFRIFPKLARRLPVPEQLISWVHGLYYLQGLATACGVGVLSFMLVSGIRPRIVSFHTAPRLLLLTAALQLCDFYRQRFFLDPRTERGLNWRAKVLKFAKWPHIFLAFYEALFRPALGYAMTTKDRVKKRQYVLARGHLPTIVLIAVAWLAGAVLGVSQNPVLQLFAAATIAASAALVLTEFLEFPDPYDEDLARERLGSAEQRPARPAHLVKAGMSQARDPAS
jgi:cellulose synthase (UDP-forming)